MSFVKAGVGFCKKTSLYINYAEVVQTLNIYRIQLEYSFVALRKSIKEEEIN